MTASGFACRNQALHIYMSIFIHSYSGCAADLRTSISRTRVSVQLWRVSSMLFSRPGEKLVSCGISGSKINMSACAAWIQFLKKEKLQNPSHFSFLSRLNGANKVKKCSVQWSNSFCHLFYFCVRHSLQAQDYCQVVFEILNVNNKRWMAIVSLW